jgi:AcrR family transcriptional regulator
MSDQLTLERPAPEAASEDNAKRRQVLDGARQVFLARGFDAASMGDIAKAAGVSKGTLYVYFENKEQLFTAMVMEECVGQAESIFDLDPSDPDVEGALMRLGVAYINFMCQPQKASAIRTVVAIADRMPSIGKVFYENGPSIGIARLGDYLRAQTKAGVLDVEYPEITAAQFLDTCHATLFKPVLFNLAPAPEPERVAHVIGVAVRAFVRAYRAK